MPPRAPALAAADRQAAIVAATVPLLRKYGRAVTTRQIAAAAGIAEGTIFRVFATKNEVIDAAIDTAFRSDQMVAALSAIDRLLPLPDRLHGYVSALQARFVEMFELLGALGMTGPPPAFNSRVATAAWRARMREATAGLVTEADGLRVPPGDVLRYLRLLTFAGTHRDITDGQLLTAAEIVDVVLDGVRAGD